MEFGRLLAERRQEASLTLREFGRMVEYDPSNLSKIERGAIAPPASNVILRKWANALSLKENTREYNDFISSGVAGTFVKKHRSEKEIEDLMPAFCRTISNKKLDPNTYEELKAVLRQYM